MNTSSFRDIQRKGRIDRMKKMYSYVSKTRHTATIIRTEEADFSDLPDDSNTCNQSIYGNMKEEIPKDIPKKLGKFVVTTYYDGFNLFHDIMTGRSVTGILYLIINTHFDWYPKI